MAENCSDIKRKKAEEWKVRNRVCKEKRGMMLGEDKAIYSLFSNVMSVNTGLVS